jgi:O-antigen/teichoic acid export membrane protein
MHNARMEKLAWILLYSGLLIAVLGWFLQGTAPLAGVALMVVGGLDAAAGVLLIWLRSRRPERD